MTKMTMEQVWAKVEANAKELLKTTPAKEVAKLLFGAESLPNNPVGMMKLKAVMTTPHFEPTDEEAKILFDRMLKMLHEHAKDIGVPQTKVKLFDRFMADLPGIAKKCVQHLSLDAAQYVIDEPHRLRVVTDKATLDLIIFTVVLGTPLTTDEQKQLMDTLFDHAMKAVIELRDRLKGGA